MTYIVYWDGGGSEVWFLPTEFINGGYTQSHAATRRFDSEEDAASYLRAHDYGGGWKITKIAEGSDSKIQGFAPQTSPDLMFLISSGDFGGQHINHQREKLPTNAVVYANLSWSGKLIVRTGGWNKFTYPIAVVKTNHEKIISVEDVRPDTFSF